MDFTSYPTQLNNDVITNEYDDHTVITSNCSRDISVDDRINCIVPSLADAARHVLGTPSHKVANAMTIAPHEGIADTGATSIFIMDGIDVDNKRIAIKPITINMPNGCKVQSTHVCDFVILGLPTPLVGHIVSNLAVASLVGICVPSIV
jgi:hypothetical protein